uniref:Uncharacterized protein n=1 Tax=Anopheles funestus TaxID=62324 RepID=A0A182RQH0_ANOFN
MFGSKLRSWMENHIVRPRKKGNKNKSGTNGNFGVLTTQNGYKSGSFAADSNIGSPARRSEVSPIQSHTTSRRGWHSPNQDNVPISPKSDHYPVQHRIHQRQTPDGGAQYWTTGYGTVNGQSGPSSFHHQQQQQQFNPGVSSPKSISRNGSSYTLESGPTNVYYSKSVDSYAVDSSLPYTMPEFDFHAGNTGPSRGPVSTGHNGHLMTVHTPTVTRSTYSTATSSSNELLEEMHPFEGARIKRLHPAATRISSSSSSSVNSTHYSVNNNHHNNNHLASGTLPTHYGSSNGHHQQPLARTQPVAPSAASENKYGKLLQQQQQNPPTKPYGPYYEQQQQQPHNGNNNNNLHYSSNSQTASNSTPGDGGSSRNASPLPTRGTSACTSPVLRPAAPTIKSNRIINGNNNNNNNSIHLDGSASGTGKTITSGSSLTASFTSKFHKLTGARSNAPDGGNSKLNHVNNNNATTTTNGTGNSTNAGPYHHQHHQHHPHHHHHQQYQINNVTTHLHPPAQPLPSGKQQPLSSSSSSSSPPPPPGTGGSSQPGAVGPAPSPTVHHLHHPSTHGHHHHHPHGPMGHTLSSPESAYSTGYSTDGTSPGGCSYTPEYYINIRTGTHYFPKGTTLPGALHGRTTAAFERTGSTIPPNASTGSHHENGSKFKCALNRIEEKHVEFCVDGEMHVAGPRASCAPVPAPNLSSFKPASGASGGAPGGNGTGALSQLQQQQPSAAAAAAQQPQSNQPPNAVAMSPIMQKNLGMQHYRSIESPSPRQRCRIRTNPWLTTADGALASVNCIKRTEQDSGSTSSGIKSSSGTDDNKNDNNKPNALSDTDSSSSTEKIINKKPFTPKSLKKMTGDISRLDSKSAPITHGSNQDSDEDATLNEMMGKFDESYHYEKETDILSCSDSDPTDCPTDIDTGQDAGDECDTDDLLDLDFIDTGSVQEVPDKETYRHTASCSIHQFPERKASCKQQRTQRSKRTNECGGGSKRRKKLVRTRKKTSDQSSALGVGDGTGVVSRGCRSLGGTPVSLRRNQQDQELRTPTRGSPLTNRCNSLTFTEVHSLHSRILAISESEKALLKADLEADVKYKQLIHEAESILFSMKSNSSICIKDLVTVPPPLPPREPQPPCVPTLAKEAPTTTTTSTISSPRRVCNPPANKRVEMLRNCEADLRRELAKTCSQKCTDAMGNPAELNPAEGVIVNKRLEVLRYETSCSLSAPNSPKNTRVLLPRKTHVTNFIHHQARPAGSSEANQANDLKTSANLSPPPPPPRRLLSKSPTIMRRRFRSQSPHLNIESDSDSDEVSRNLDSKTNGKVHRANHNNKENLTNHPQPISFPQSTPKNIAGKQMNNYRHTIHGSALMNGEDTGNGFDGTTVEGIPNGGNHGSNVTGMHKSPLISFRSVDIGSPVTDDSYCPQSEPLKRKIYTCSAAFEKIQRSLHHDPDAKQQLIIDALAEIKRSLEDQSVELHELNNTEN